MRHRHSGFTLIEVLIVVVIMAVLAATIIPQFTSSTIDAKESARDFNTHSLQAQIELYRIDHNGLLPTIDSAYGLEQLTKATNAAGTAIPADSTTPEDYPFGPYILNELPKNPFNGYNTVADGTGEGVVAGSYGWQYDDATGRIWPNDTQYWDAQAAE